MAALKPAQSINNPNRSDEDGDYTTNMGLEDVTDGRAWIAYEYDGAPLDPEHGGPARLLVPQDVLVTGCRAGEDSTQGGAG